MKVYRITYWTADADTIRATFATESKDCPYETAWQLFHPFHIVAIEPMS